jgi:hypothetical protein
MRSALTASAPPGVGALVAVDEAVGVEEVVGLMVGEIVGLTVGLMVGEIVGLIVGLMVGEIVGLVVGVEDVVGVAVE